MTDNLFVYHKKSVFAAITEGMAGYSNASDSTSLGSMSHTAQKVSLLFPVLSVCAAKPYVRAFLFTLPGSVGLASPCVV